MTSLIRLTNVSLDVSNGNDAGSSKEDDKSQKIGDGIEEDQNSKKSHESFQFSGFNGSEPRTSSQPNVSDGNNQQTPYDGPVFKFSGLKLKD